MSAEMATTIITLIIYFGLVSWIGYAQKADYKLQREQSKRENLAEALKQVEKSNADNRLRNLARTALEKAQQD